MATYIDVFDRHFRKWVAAACANWGYSAPGSDFYRHVRDRLGNDIVEWIGFGIEAGLIHEAGLQFNLEGNAAGKGPYKWFSRRTNTHEPQCNWEYYVQVAFFVRLSQPCGEAGLRLTFEDELMDLAVRTEGDLLWCIEVKERAVQLESLLAQLESHQHGVDMGAPDRGDDPLRKAKYLMRHQPKFFSLVAIGVQRDFEVTYRGSHAFSLSETKPPLNPMSELP